MPLGHPSINGGTACTVDVSHAGDSHTTIQALPLPLLVNIATSFHTGPDLQTLGLSGCLRKREAVGTSFEVPWTFKPVLVTGTQHLALAVSS